MIENSKDVNIVGRKFGKLTPVCIFKKRNKGCKKEKVFCICECECGNRKVLSKDTLVSGHSTHCGCVKREIKHGLGRDKRLYNIYCLMKYRCENPESKAYKDYGGRGIKLCKEWKNPNNFQTWSYKNGYKPNLTIERIDVNGDYSPDNCKWIPRNEQNKNTRKSVKYEFLGITLNVCDWRLILRIPSTSFYRQIKKRSHEEIFTKHLHKEHEIENLEKAVWYINDEIKRLKGEYNK